MSDKDNSSSSGLGISTVVFIVFLILKLCKVINWSWWWVTSPLWLSVSAWILLIIFAFVIVGVAKALFK